jgi:hypothetical protein
MVDNTPTREELHEEVHRMVTTACGLVPGDIPEVGSLAWWAADPPARIAGLLVAAEAFVVEDRDAYAREQLKQMTSALSGPDGYWRSVASGHVTHAELTARREEPGPVWDQFDREATQRWVDTGSSEPTARPSTTTPRRAAA